MLRTMSENSGGDIAHGKTAALVMVSDGRHHVRHLVRGHAQIREDLKANGVELTDIPNGVRWKRI